MILVYKNTWLILARLSLKRVLIEMNLALKAVVGMMVGACLLPLIGCGSSGDSRLPNRNEISGTVTLDGQKIDNGSITFFSEKDAARGIQASAVSYTHLTLPTTPYV